MKKRPPKVRRKEGKLFGVGKMLISSAWEEKIMVDDLGKVISSEMTGKIRYQHVFYLKEITVVVNLVISHLYGQKVNFPKQ